MNFQKTVFICVLIFVAFICNSSFSAPVNTRLTKVNMLFDEDQNVNPDLYIPLPWTMKGNLMSGIGFQKGETSYIHPINGFDESRISGSLKEDRLSLMVLDWSSKDNDDQSGNGLNYSLGLLADYMDISRTESGYFHYDPDNDGPWVALDNTVDITFIQPSLYGSLEYRISPDNIIKSLHIITSASVSPVSFLSVDQETHAKPLVGNPGKSDHSESQYPGYAMGLSVTVDTDWFVDAILECTYEYLPMEYTLSFLQYDSGSDSFSFEERSVENNESTTVVEFKLRINLDIHSLHPVVGVRYENVKTDDNAGLEDTESFNYTIIGFEGAF